MLSGLLSAGLNKGIKSLVSGKQSSAQEQKDARQAEEPSAQKDQQKLQGSLFAKVIGIAKPTTGLLKFLSQPPPASAAGQPLTGGISVKFKTPDLCLTMVGFPVLVLLVPVAWIKVGVVGSVGGEFTLGTNQQLWVGRGGLQASVGGFANITPLLPPFVTFEVRAEVGGSASLEVDNPPATLMQNLLAALQPANQQVDANAANALQGQTTPSQLQLPSDLSPDLQRELPSGGVPSRGSSLIGKLLSQPNLDRNGFLQQRDTPSNPPGVPATPPTLTMPYNWIFSWGSFKQLTFEVSVLAGAVAEVSNTTKVAQSSTTEISKVGTQTSTETESDSTTTNTTEASALFLLSAEIDVSSTQETVDGETVNQTQTTLSHEQSTSTATTPRRRWEAGLA